MFKKLLVALGLASAALILPLTASAAPQDQQIHGRVVSFNHAYSLQVRDNKGYIDNVQLHPGTIINPTGLTLADGMIVSIDGYSAGSYFVANEINTPYTFYGGVPYYSGHPWYYYGPSVSLGFFFGNSGWWHGGGRPVVINHINHTTVVNHNVHTNVSHTNVSHTNVSHTNVHNTNTHVANHAPAHHGGAPVAHAAAPTHVAQAGSHMGGGGHH